MTILITAEDVIDKNRLPDKTKISSDDIEEAQNIIDGRLGDSFDLSLISDTNKTFYYNAIKRQTFLLMMELPNSDFLWNNNARYENSEYASLENEKSKVLARIQARIDYYISKIQEEMEDDGTDTEQIDEVLKIPGMTIIALGGDKSYYPENDYSKYPDGVIDE